MYQIQNHTIVMTTKQKT